MRTNEALGAARQRRQALYQAMADVEHEAQSPARTEAWLDDLGATLKRLAEAFHAHVVATEAPDGIIAQIVADAPRLANEAKRLEEEHPMLEETIAPVAAKVKGAGVLDRDVVAEIRGDVLWILGALSGHRSAGSDFVWDAYALDIGGYG